jgi:hypothetical protein
MEFAIRFSSSNYGLAPNSGWPPYTAIALDKRRWTVSQRARFGVVGDGYVPLNKWDRLRAGLRPNK